MENTYFQFKDKDGRIANILLATSVTYVPPVKWETYQKFAGKGDRVKYKNFFGKVKERSTEFYKEDMYISDFSERLGEYDEAMTRDELLDCLTKYHGVTPQNILFDKDGYLCDTHAVYITDLAGKRYYKHFKKKSDALKYLEEVTNKLTLIINGE